MNEFSYYLQLAKSNQKIEVEVISAVKVPD